MRSAPILFAALIGCTFQDNRQGELCTDDTECTPGLLCVRGLCTPTDRVQDARPPGPDLRVDRSDVAVPPPRDAAPSAPDARPPILDAAPPPPDAAPPPPVDAAPPPPDAAPPDMAPPPQVSPTDPILDRPGCRPDIWCALPDADSSVARGLPDMNGGGQLELWVSDFDSDDLRTDTFIRFALDPLAGREVVGLSLVMDVIEVDRAQQGAVLQVQRSESEWGEFTVRWNDQPGLLGEPTEVAAPSANTRLVRWPILEVLRDGGRGPPRLPRALSLRMRADADESSAGFYRFTSRERGRQNADDAIHGPRLEIRLGP